MCISPFTKDGYHLPCGKCLDCRKKRASAWSFRLLKEAEVSTSAFFITLTYDNEHVPISPKGFMTLEYRPKPKKGEKYKSSHTQLFLKLLRKENPPLKYFLVGEYGGKGERPHYHIIIFNLELDTLVTTKEYNLIKNGIIQLNGKHELNVKKWQYGHITIGKLEPASAAYCLKYISKESKIGKYDWDDRRKTFTNMSKGLGASYLSENQIKWHKGDILNRMYIVLNNNAKITMPRYYKEKIYSQWQRQKYSENLQKKLTCQHLERSYSQNEAIFKKEEQIRLAKMQKQQHENTKIDTNKSI